MSRPGMNRRDFMQLLAVTGGTIAAGGVVGSCTNGESAHQHMAPTEPGLAKGGGTTAARTTVLKIPQGLSSGTLTAQASAVGILAGKNNTPAWLYNGQFPAPTIELQSGVAKAIAFTNNLSQHSVTHWHGLLVEPANDGHPRYAVGSGGTIAYSLKTLQRASLNFYHPHPHMHTGEQVYRGLAGALVVRDAEDTGAAGNTYGLPYGPYEVPLVIRDATFDSAGNLQFSNKSSGFWGNTPLVNGTYQPYLPVDKAIYRFRGVNGCNARVLRLAITGGTSMDLIGNDGGLLDKAYTISEITAAPGERFDLLVDLRGLSTGQSLMLRDLDAGWDILEFRGTGVVGGNGNTPVKTFTAIAPLGAPVTSRRFTFDGMTRINGRVYDMMRNDFNVPFGAVEQWTFVTNGNGPHPVHVHGAHFQVVKRTGGRGTTFAWEKGWKDTVLVNDGETVEVLIRFVAHRGEYLMHCHQLAHEDAGMMANFTVV